MINYFKSYSSLGDDFFLCHPVFDWASFACWKDPPALPHTVRLVRRLQHKFTRSWYW